MGGSILVGIKRRNGEEYIAERWTNPTPYWFNDPDFYNEDEKLVEEYISQDEKERCEAIHPSVYGVILYDAINSEVLSVQNYSAIGCRHLFLFDQESLELVKKLNDLKCITDIKISNLWGNTSSWGDPGQTIKPEDFPRLIALFENIILDYNFKIKEEDKCSFEVNWKKPGLNIQHKGCKAYERWSDILSWLKKNNWNTPAWSQKEINTRYKHSK